MGIQKIAFFGKYDTEDTFEVSVTTETEEFGELAREFAGFAVAMGYDPETVSEFVKVDDDVIDECCRAPKPVVFDEPTHACDAASYAAKSVYPNRQVEFTEGEYRFIRDLIAHVGGKPIDDEITSIRNKLEGIGYPYSISADRFSGSLAVK